VKRRGSTLHIIRETFAAKSALTALVSQTVRAEGRCDGEESRNPTRAVLKSYARVNRRALMLISGRKRIMWYW
jgi:hypothetical protein